MHYQLVKTPEYEKWLKEETFKSRVQIADRLSKIETDGYFGTFKDLGDEVFELIAE